MFIKLLSAVVVGLLLLAVLAGFSSFLWFPGITPNQSARILMEDEKFGARALGMCHVWGDWVLKPLREASQGSTALNARNSVWLSDVLIWNGSKRSLAFAAELHQRDELLARLVGATALAAHGRLPEAEFRPGGDIHSVLIDEQYRDRTVWVDTTPLELALIAAEKSRSHESVPAILELIETRPFHYWVHAHAADALSAIGDPRAVPVLEDAMRSSDFYALPNAFRALAELRDPRAIPLAIARIEPGMEEEHPFLVEELEDVTGQRFGFDRARWQTWWETQKPRESGP